MDGCGNTNFLFICPLLRVSDCPGKLQQVQQQLLQVLHSILIIFTVQSVYIWTTDLHKWSPSHPWRLWLLLLSWTLDRLINCHPLNVLNQLKVACKILSEEKICSRSQEAGFVTTSYRNHNSLCRKAGWSFGGWFWVFMKLLVSWTFCSLHRML